MKEKNVFQVMLDIYHQIKKIREMIVFSIISGFLQGKDLITYETLIFQEFLTFQ